MKIIGTVNKTYLAETTTINARSGDILQLQKAAIIDLNKQSAEIARDYVKGTITGKVSDVEVNTQNIVSIQDADEIGPLVDLMMKYLPLAEKQARANTILPELDAMMRATAPTAPKV
jgi:hypothetical protein